ncbi:MAG TPA: GDP-mannose 4,6-dehydratase [Gemmatimonadaceae bacterium]|nr:GDP-mannose 4,6-dehydratase [Gemmatimonadaceae bacterium]
MEDVDVTAFWRERPVFVTGASGLLGSWLVEELVRRGARVTCLVRDWVPESRLMEGELLARVRTVRGELEDHALLLRAINEYEIDTVFHLGAQTIVGTAARSALSTFEANIRGSWNLLEACRACSRLVTRVVVASSDKAYGSHDALPYTEELPLQGRFPYDVSKSCTDLIAFSYFHTYRLPVAVTRCGNLFGGGDLNFNRLIPGTIRSVLLGEAPVIRSDGTFVRDYFYVQDAVEAYLQLAERLPDERFVGQAFNFGTETPLSVIELVERILQLTGRPELRPRILNEATHEIPRQYLDCTKARRMLGWRPAYSLDEGLLATIAWYRERLARDAAERAAAERAATVAARMG